MLYKLVSIMCLMLIAGQGEEVPINEDGNETEMEEISKVRTLFFLDFKRRSKNDDKTRRSQSFHL